LVATPGNSRFAVSRIGTSDHPDLVIRARSAGKRAARPNPYDQRVTRLRLQNESTEMLCVFVEPLGEDFWIAPAQTLVFTGSTSEPEVDCIWHAQGVSVWMDDAPAYGFVVTTQEGEVVECGYQRPPGAFDSKP
jgi:hypothetical protein